MLTQFQEFKTIISQHLFNCLNICIERLGECLNSQHICCDQSRDPVDDTTVKYVRERMTCGVRHEEGVGFKISGGNEAQFGEFPWIVIIFKKKFKDGKEFLQFSCAGSLIHLKIILTAAHCVRSYA